MGLSLPELRGSKLAAKSSSNSIMSFSSVIPQPSVKFVDSAAWSWGGNSEIRAGLSHS